MAYFKINDIDFSNYVNGLDVKRKASYHAQTNAAGDTVVDYINHKRTIEVKIIPLDSTTMSQLQNAIKELNVSISYTDPRTGVLAQNVNCIIPENNVEYYTIQANKVLFQAFKLKFIEL